MLEHALDIPSSATAREYRDFDSWKPPDGSSSDRTTGRARGSFGGVSTEGLSTAAKPIEEIASTTIMPRSQARIPISRRDAPVSSVSDFINLGFLWLDKNEYGMGRKGKTEQTRQALPGVNLSATPFMQ